MAFRIHRGIWQFQKPDGAYESKYKLNDSGQLVETDTEGNETGGMTASVSWASISGRPTALSGFTNDLGNYGGWLSTSGKAADSETVDGVDSSRIVYGEGSRKSTSLSTMNSSTDNVSGFFFYNNPTGGPFSDWTHWINVIGNSWSNNYGFQLAHAFHSDRFAVRVIANGGWGSWRTVIDSGNIGDQSVNYASTAGNSSTTSQTSFSSLSTGGGLRDSLNRRFVVPDGGSYATSTSVITGAIRIKLPTQGSGMMMTCTAKVYEYSLSKSFTITFGGHRDGNSWYNQFCYIDGDTNRGNLTVRFGVSDGRDCVWIGETNSSWSYPQVFITDMQVGYTAIDSRWASGWSIDFVTSFDTINRTSTAYAKITNANIGDQSVNYAASAGNADTVDGWHRDDLRAWGNLTGVPSTFSPSAHTHDDRYYTETEVDTLLAGKQAAGTYLTSLPSHNHDDRYFTETESDSRFLKLAGGTLTGQLNLHAGSYEGSIVFGSQATWRTGIRQHDDGDAELRIWAKHASGMIFIATGYDGEPASISRPTDGLAIQGNKLGIGNFSTSDPSYKLHVKGDIYANGGWVRVSGSDGIYFESYGGGWHMTDSTWIRSYSSKPIYVDQYVRADQGFEVSGHRVIGSDKNVNAYSKVQIGGFTIQQSAAGDLEFVF